MQTNAPAKILALALLFLSTMFLKLLFVCGTMTRKEIVPCVTKIQVSKASRFLVGAERSRCHEAMFNRISPSLLDIFHDSRAVSHFLDDITPHIFVVNQLVICGKLSYLLPLICSNGSAILFFRRRAHTSKCYCWCLVKKLHKKAPNHLTPNGLQRVYLKSPLYLRKTTCGTNLVMSMKKLKNTQPGTKEQCVLLQFYITMLRNI